MGSTRLLAVVLIILTSAWDCTDGSAHWTLNQATGVIEMGVAPDKGVKAPSPDGSTFLDLTWALESQGGAIWQSGLAGEFAHFRDRLSCSCLNPGLLETACQAGACNKPQCHCGPYSTTLWPPPNSHPLESVPPGSQPYLARAESWTPIFGTSAEATIELFRKAGADSHQGLFTWGSGFSANGLGAEACPCGNRLPKSCNGCEAGQSRSPGGWAAGQKTPPGRGERGMVSGGASISPAKSAYASIRRLENRRGRRNALEASPLGDMNTNLSTAPLVSTPLRALASDIFSDIELGPETELLPLFEPYGGAEPAVTLLDRSVSANPGDPSLWNDLGNAHRALGQAGLAVECFRIGLELQPHPDLFLNLGSVVFRGGHWEEAREIFEEGLLLDGRHVLLLFCLASTHMALGQLDDAARRFEEVSALQPTFVEAELQHRSIKYRRLRSSKQYQGALLLAGSAVLFTSYAGLRLIRAPMQKPHPAVQRMLNSPSGPKKKKRF